MAVMLLSYQPGWPYVLTLLSSVVCVELGISPQYRGHIFGPVDVLSCASHMEKKSPNDDWTSAAWICGAFEPSFLRGEGLMIRKTLSPVVFGLVCVPW